MLSATFALDYDLPDADDAWLRVAADHGLSIGPRPSHARQLLTSRRAKRRDKMARDELLMALNASYVESAALAELDDRRIERINSTGLTLIEIYAARHDYERRLAMVPKRSRHLPSRRLKAFQAATTDVRNRYASQIGGQRLAGEQRAVEALNPLLMELFDLDDADRNELMRRMKQYRDLLARQATLERKLAQQQSTLVTSERRRNWSRQ